MRIRIATLEYTELLDSSWFAECSWFGLPTGYYPIVGYQLLYKEKPMAKLMCYYRKITNAGVMWCSPTISNVNSFLLLLLK